MAQRLLALILAWMVLVAPLAHGAEASTIARALQPHIDQHEVSGAVTLVASKDEIVSLEAIGFADIASGYPMRADTIFWIASMSKPVTATALIMLVDEGKVRLDDPVKKYLPDFAPRIMHPATRGTKVSLQKPVHAITVKQLLTHQSGMPFSSAMEAPKWDALPLELAVRSYSVQPLTFEPGSSYLYSNAGINTAARIVEVVSGLTFEEFLRQRLFEPLGMKDTTFWPTSVQLPRLAKSYKPNSALTDLEESTISYLHYPLSDHSQRYPCPAAGLFSTAGDMAKFSQMILNGGVYAGRRFLSESLVRQMTSNQKGAATEDGYGLGWITQGSGTFGHEGAYGTNMTIDPTRGLVTIWMVQAAGFVRNDANSRLAFERVVREVFDRTEQ